MIGPQCFPGGLRKVLMLYVLMVGLYTRDEVVTRDGDGLSVPS